MKNLLILIFPLLSLAPLAHSQEVAIGTIQWSGKSYNNATAKLVGNDIKISSKSGYTSIPWSEADTFLQFKFKKQREEWEVKHPATPKESPVPNLFQVAGTVYKVTTTGTVIQCDADTPSWQVSGLAFIRGLSGLAYTEPFKGKAIKTTETIQLEGMTLRVYDLVPKV